MGVAAGAAYAVARSSISFEKENIVTNRYSTLEKNHDGKGSGHLS